MALEPQLDAQVYVDSILIFFPDTRDFLHIARDVQREIDFADHVVVVVVGDAYFLHPQADGLLDLGVHRSVGIPGKFGVKMNI